MREQVTDPKSELIEQIIDRDEDDDMGAREARRIQLRKKTWIYLKKIWDDGEEKEGRAV